MVRSKSASSVSWIGPVTPEIPALLIMMSSAPKRSTHRSIAATMSSSLVTSQRMKATSSPSSAASRSPASTSMSAITQRAPSATYRRTIPSPMPRAPPVTTADETLHPTHQCPSLMVRRCIIVSVDSSLPTAPAATICRVFIFQPSTPLYQVST